MKIITFKIPEVLLRYLDEYCAKEGVPRSEVIRRAIEEYLHRQDAIRPTTIRVHRVKLD